MYEGRGIYEDTKERLGLLYAHLVYFIKVGYHRIVLQTVRSFSRGNHRPQIKALPLNRGLYPSFKRAVVSLRGRKLRWEHVVIAFLLGLLLASHVQATPLSGTVMTPITHLKTLPKLKTPVLKPQHVVALKPVAAPATAITGGCQIYWSGDYYLDNIIRFESGGNSCATNYLGCFGLLQACPGYPLRIACGGNPTCQIAWFEANKTGGRSWAQVWAHELAYGWW